MEECGLEVGRAWSTGYVKVYNPYLHRHTRLHVTTCNMHMAHKWRIFNIILRVHCFRPVLHMCVAGPQLRFACGTQILNFQRLSSKYSGWAPFSCCRFGAYAYFDFFKILPLLKSYSFLKQPKTTMSEVKSIEKHLGYLSRSAWFNVTSRWYYFKAQQISGGWPLHKGYQLARPLYRSSVPLYNHPVVS